MKRGALVRKCKPGQMPVNNPARLDASSLDKDTPLSVPIVPSPWSTMVVSRMQTAPAAGTGSSAVLAKLMEKL